MSATENTSGSRLAAMLSVSRSVVEDNDLTSTLNHIAKEAAGAIGARGATIHLVGRNRLRLAGAWGVSSEYLANIEERIAVPIWEGPVGRAFRSRRQLVIDLENDREMAGWRDRARTEGYRSLAATPLDIDGDFVGALDVYRSDPGPWPKADLELLSYISDHAATALRIANLVDHHARRLDGFEQVLRGLREQAHEHANRVHAISALVSLGEQDEARRFIAEILRELEESQQAVVSGIDNSTLAGLLLAEIIVARQRGIVLNVDRRSRLSRLPERLSEAQSVALVGHLLEYAFEGLGDVPAPRRRVTLRAWNEDQDVLLRLRDWGNPFVSQTEPREIDGVIINPSRSKHHAPSLAQSLFFEAADAAEADISFQSQKIGTITTVRVPS